jgi:hypothetical protein
VSCVSECSHPEDRDLQDLGTTKCSSDVGRKTGREVTTGLDHIATGNRQAVCAGVDWFELAHCRCH